MRQRKYATNDDILTKPAKTNPIQIQPCHENGSRARKYKSKGLAITNNPDPNKIIKRKRYKDGRITHGVVWSSLTVGEYSPIRGILSFGFKSAEISWRFNSTFEKSENII